MACSNAFPCSRFRGLDFRNSRARGSVSGRPARLQSRPRTMRSGRALAGAASSGGLTGPSPATCCGWEALVSHQWASAEVSECPQDTAASFSERAHQKLTGLRDPSLVVLGSRACAAYTDQPLGAWEGTSLSGTIGAGHPVRPGTYLYISPP